MNKWTPVVPLGAAAAVAGLVLSVAGGGESPVTSLTSVPAAASTDSQGAPSYLPSIASLERVDHDEHGIVRQYALAGKANANTLTPQGLAATPTKVHPATRLTVYYVPDLSEAGTPPLDPAFFAQATVDVGGAKGTLTTPKSGLGVVRVDWVDSAGGYHLVLTERLTTPEGPAGLPADEVLKIARSVS